MLARRFVCPICGDETEIPAAFAEGEAPVCCGFEMVELTPQAGPPRAQAGSATTRMPRWLSRRFVCPRCEARPGELCKRDDGSPRASSHRERQEYGEKVMAETRAKRVARGLDPIPPRRGP